MCVIFSDRSIFQCGEPCGIVLRDVCICKYVETADRTSRVANYIHVGEHVAYVIVQTFVWIKNTL